MARGVLRVYLGSAPGVGKTYRMLDEGWRRRERGTDVVVGYVETHDRPLTNAQLRDLEVIARVTREYRGAQLEEMDLDAILARAPNVALIDELAHTNVPGGAHEKRWQDVEQILDAGIDVITTVNIQHLESVNDVVEKITGITQQETVPDAVVRRAEQIEIVDVTPEALRRRMAHGNIYKADKIDASLSNYFRVGNLSALRELALLWLADRVEDALRQYQDDHDIAQTWETRERLIVGVTGTDTDEALLRRAARIASRTGAELFAVHVVSTDAVRTTADTTVARELVREFEGRFEEVVEDDVATALVSFARTERGTQIVLGASRPRAPWRPPSGVVEKVLRHARDLDVHIIAVGGERPVHVHPRRVKQRVTWRRRSFALGAAVVSLPVITLALTAMRTSVSLSTVFLIYLMAVLALGAWGGVGVGVAAGLAASGPRELLLRPAAPHASRSRVPTTSWPWWRSSSSRWPRACWWAGSPSAAPRPSAPAARPRSWPRPPPAWRPRTRTWSRCSTRCARSTTRPASRCWPSAPRAGPSTWRAGSPSDGFVTGDAFPIDENHRLIFTGRDARRPGPRPHRRVRRPRRGQPAQPGHRARLGAVRGVRRGGVAAPGPVSHRGHRPARAPRGDPGDRRVPAARRRRRRARPGGRSWPRSRRASSDSTAWSPTWSTPGASRRARSRRRARRSRSPTWSTRPSPGSTRASAASRSRSRPTRASSSPTAYLAQRALANVITNACRFGPIDEPVRVRAAIVGDLRRDPRDRPGAGHARAQREVVAAPFQHLSGAQLNAGINLTVAAGFVQLLGGRLYFEDTPGGGLTVADRVAAVAGLTLHGHRRALSHGRLAPKPFASPFAFPWP